MNSEDTMLIITGNYPSSFFQCTWLWEMFELREGSNYRRVATSWGVCWYFLFLKHPDGVRNLQESGREQGWGYGQSLKSADFVRWSRRVSVSSNGWFLKLGYLPQTLDKCGQNNSKSNHVWWFIAPIYGPLRDGVFLLLFFSHIIRYDLTCMHQDAHSALAAFLVVRCVPGVFSHYQGRLVIHLIYTSR